MWRGRQDCSSPVSPRARPPRAGPRPPVSGSRAAPAAVAGRAGCAAISLLSRGAWAKDPPRGWQRGGTGRTQSVQKPDAGRTGGRSARAAASSPPRGGARLSAAAARSVARFLSGRGCSLGSAWFSLCLCGSPAPQGASPTAGSGAPTGHESPRPGRAQTRPPAREQPGPAWPPGPPWSRMFCAGSVRPASHGCPAAPRNRNHRLHGFPRGRRLSHWLAGLSRRVRQPGTRRLPHEALAP